MKIFETKINQISENDSFVICSYIIYVDVLVIEWVVLGCCIVALICAMVLLCGCCFRRLRLNRRGTSKSRHKKELCDMGDGTSAVPTTQPHEYYYISDVSSKFKDIEQLALT